MKYKLMFVGFIAITASLSLIPIDNPHFYRATNNILEPRLEHDYLTTFDLTIGGGSTDKGRNSHNDIVPLLDIYGKSNLSVLDPLLGTVSIDGSFKIIESNLSLFQNLSKGLLLFFHLPIRSLSIKNISFDSISTKTLSSLLAHYGISASTTTSAGAGDLTSWIGWTHNYQETETIDFIDATLMAGFLAPTGKKRNENKLFSLPTGYNGHWGVPLCTMFSIGYYEWITIGAYLNTLFFAQKNQNLRLKTDQAESGIIKLATGDVSVRKGTLVNTGLYFKADHFGHGFSFTTTYSFASQQPDHLTPKNPYLFNSSIINSDTMLKGWNMHTFNFFLEYDFARQNSKVGNRIGLFYNVQIAGKRTFNTNVTGGTYGLDIGWSL